jgi:TrmH family RNA methyltransferase
MFSKTTIKYIRSLRDQKYRQKYHKIVVEGVKTIRDIVADRLVEIEELYATRAWIEEMPALWRTQISSIVEVEDHTLAAMSSFTTAQQVLAVCTMPNQSADLREAMTSLCLYLDGIRDPGNMGTIFRVADWFGIRNIFLAEDCVDPFNPKVIQASMGSLFRVQWKEIPLLDIFQLPGIQVYATTMHGKSIYTHDLSRNGIIILGNESTGIRTLPEHAQLHLISIPADFRLGADSLNVAVSAGIICAEFRRRKV